MAEVYKRTNPDGSVEFSDVPPTIEAEPIEVEQPSTYSPPPLPTPTTTTNTQAQQTRYENVRITSPTDDATIRDNTGTIDISVASKPALFPGHQYDVQVDGTSMAKGKANKLSVTNVDRGSHTIRVQVIDKEGKTVASSQTITIHLHRFSSILNRPPAPAPKVPK